MFPVPAAFDGGRQWRFAFASAIGSSHGKTGSPCQDSSACEIIEHAEGPLLLAVAADGAGSARHSEIGSRLACFVTVERVRSLVERGGGIEDIDRAFAEDVIERFQVGAENVARLSGRRQKDFACTLLVAVVTSGRAAYWQIGDGAIVVSRPEHPGQYEWVFWPQQGEYANETLFATGSYACEKLQFATRDEHVEEVAVFSDGIQNLVLDYKTKSAHSGFFRPMFGAVRRLRAGYSDELSGALGRYLNSRSILSRTDDDKTLILATCRHPVPAPALPATRPSTRVSGLAVSDSPTDAHEDRAL